jgi:hypothetical protein
MPPPRAMPFSSAFQSRYLTSSVCSFCLDLFWWDWGRVSSLWGFVGGEKATPSCCCCCGGVRNAVEFCYSEIEIPRLKLLNGFWKYVCAEIHRKMSNREKEMHGVIVLERNQRALLLLFGYLVAAAVVAVASFFSFLFVVEQRGIAEA